MFEGHASVVTALMQSTFQASSNVRYRSATATHGIYITTECSDACCKTHARTKIPSFNSWLPASVMYHAVLVFIFFFVIVNLSQLPVDDEVASLPVPCHVRHLRHGQQVNQQIFFDIIYPRLFLSSFYFLAYVPV